MPKKVDHHERRELIAAALMRVAAEQGLEAVSLRHVAAAAGVTSGMVQHYFPTKKAMLDFAMQSASARYEARMTEAVTELGKNPPARDLVRAILMALLPLDESQHDEGRVALAFLSYAATNRSADKNLGEDSSALRELIADQVRTAQLAGESPANIDPGHAGTALWAMAEGLGVHVLSGTIPTEAARAALDAQLDLIFGSPRS